MDTELIWIRIHNTATVLECFVIVVSFRAVLRHYQTIINQKSILPYRINKKRICIWILNAFMHILHTENWWIGGSREGEM